MRGWRLKAQERVKGRGMNLSFVFLVVFIGNKKIKINIKNNDIYVVLFTLYTP